MSATAQPSATASYTDRIEKKFTVAAPRSRVWRAISDSQEFGTWFRMRLEGPFVAGKPISGNITHPGYEHVKENGTDVTCVHDFRRASVTPLMLDLTHHELLAPLREWKLEGFKQEG